MAGGEIDGVTVVKAVAPNEREDEDVVVAEVVTVEAGVNVAAAVCDGVVDTR